MKTDILVLGGGGSGMCAAVAATQAGKRVMILEKGKKMGGNSVFPRGGGFAAGGTKYQKDVPKPFGVKEVYDNIMDYTHHRGNGPLLKAFLDNTEDTLEWLESFGIEFENVPEQFVFFTTAAGGYPTGVPIHGNGAAVILALKEQIVKLGVDVLTEAAATRLIMEAGKCIGAVYEKDGREEQIEAKCVIIATGGFGNNPDMVRKYTGFELYKNMFPITERGMNGDGIRMAWEAGAAREGVGCQIIFGVNGPGKQTGGMPSLAQEPQLIVDQTGHRFMNETEPNPTYKGNTIARQAGGVGYLIFDEPFRRGMEEDGFTVPNMFFRDSRLKNFDILLERNPYWFRADTLEELADCAGLSREVFRKTVERYNYLCDEWEDYDFGKGGGALNEIRTAPFYAIQLTPQMYGTMGGIRVNENLQVLNEQLEPIHGLYAVGYDGNGCLGSPVSDYSMKTPGLTFGFALNSGKMAGRHAAEHME